MKASEQLAAYVAAAWEPEDLIEVRPLPAGKGTRRWVKASRLSSFADGMQEENQNGANFYAGILPRAADGKGRAEDCLPGKIVWADFDGIDTRSAWRIVKSLEMPDPTMVVNSGHGAHLFWALEEKIEPQKLAALVKDLAHHVGSDLAATDVARILRLPGFINWKDPRADAVLVFHSASRYRFDAIRAAVPIWVEKKEPAPSRKAGSREDLMERARAYCAKIRGVTKGSGESRTTTAYKMAAALVRDFSLEDGDALDILTGWDARENNPPIVGDPAYPGGLEEIIRNARKHGKHPNGKLADQEQPSSGVAVAKVQPDNSKTLEAMSAEIEAIRSGKNKTVPLPWPILSDQSRALAPGTVCIIAGTIKVGKSFMVLNICDHLENVGVPWRYLPLEDSRTFYGWRFLSIMAKDYRVLDDDEAGIEARDLALVENHQRLEKMMERVSENPRFGHKDKDGATVVPRLPPSSVVTWARDALKVSRVAFIDPVSQIDFSARDRTEEEGAFIRQLLGMAADSGGTIVLVMHTTKKPMVNAREQPFGADSAEDIQGSAMFTRLAQTTLVFNAHDWKTSSVKETYTFRSVEHNRTVTIAAARNGKGNKRRIAMVHSGVGPIFTEEGLIAPGAKSR